MNPESTSAPPVSPAGGLFPLTRWSVVLGAKAESGPALNTLFGTYRQPLFIYLRGKGCPHHEAEDLVQGFCEHLLKRDFLANVAQEKGKFRTFLLVSFKRYLRDLWRKRKPDVVYTLDDVDEDGRAAHEPVSRQPGPATEYDLAWAQAILANALRRLEAESARTGHQALCQALEPVLFQDEDALPLADIAEQVKMSPGAVKTAACRLRQRLRGLIRDEILQTVANERDLEEELGYLLSLFGR
jgi:RNA polymerase sigma factor (sigma-70 family)